MTPLIIFHANCPDGWGAAWWLGKHLGEHEKHPGFYDRLAPVAECEGRDVWIVDFCYPTIDLLSIADVANTLTVFDHHQTARGWMEQAADWKDTEVLGLHEACNLLEMSVAGRVVLAYESHMSGVGMVARYVARTYGTPIPEFLRRIEDRDLWRFAHSDTKAVFAAVTSRPYDVDHWDAMWVTPHADLILEGEGINRYRDQLIAQCVEQAYEYAVLGHVVWVAACPYAIGSDVASELAKRNPELFGAYYVDGPHGRKWGLRSTEEGMDVAALAQTVGGGGHRHAAGFEQKIWGLTTDV